GEIDETQGSPGFIVKRNIKIFGVDQVINDTVHALQHLTALYRTHCKIGDCIKRSLQLFGLLKLLDSGFFLYHFRGARPYFLLQMELAAAQGSSARLNKHRYGGKNGERYQQLENNGLVPSGFHFDRQAQSAFIPYSAPVGGAQVPCVIAGRKVGISRNTSPSIRLYPVG